MQVEHRHLRCLRLRQMEMINILQMILPKMFLGSCWAARHQEPANLINMIQVPRLLIYRKIKMMMKLWIQDSHSHLHRMRIQDRHLGHYRLFLTYRHHLRFHHHHRKETVIIHQPRPMNLISLRSLPLPLLDLLHLPSHHNLLQTLLLHRELLLHHHYQQHPHRNRNHTLNGRKKVGSLNRRVSILWSSQRLKNTPNGLLAH